MTLDVYAGLFDDELDDVADRVGTAAESARDAQEAADQVRTDADEDEGGASDASRWPASLVEPPRRIELRT
jgi:hypothetical protein